jgi:hypothetical protein
MAIVSRNVPPFWAVTTIKPALGGASSTSFHSSCVKSAFPVIRVAPLRVDESKVLHPGAQDRRLVQHYGQSPNGHEKLPKCALADARHRARLYRAITTLDALALIETAPDQSGAEGGNPTLVTIRDGDSSPVFAESPERSG